MPKQNTYDESGAVHGALDDGVNVIQLEAAKAELGLTVATDDKMHFDKGNEKLLATIQHHAQMMVDHIALGYCRVGCAEQSRLQTAIENLETALLYTRKGLRSTVVRHDG